jgi:hypothetical protein
MTSRPATYEERRAQDSFCNKAKRQRADRAKGGRFILIELPPANLQSLLIYLGLSVCLFGLRTLPHLSTSYFGFSHDPGVLIWSLEWWPRAILHGHNPFYCHLVWAPVGTNLTWMTSIPGLSLLVAPITLSSGPVAAYNILTVTGPALSAWAAYILCRHITQAFWPAVFGGWIYGFSTYEWHEVLWGHLFLSWALVPPLVVHLVLLLLQRAIAARRFVIYFAAALAAQFSISTEVFATMTIFGALALAFSALVLPGLRSRIYRATVLIACAYGLAATALSPFLWHLFVAPGFSREPIYPPMFYSNGVLAPFIPGSLNLVGPHHLTVSENGAYIGPLLALIAFFAFSRSPRVERKLLLLMLLVIYLVSLGPRLYIMNHTIPLPWSLIARVPVINNALPVRFILYGWLVTAIIGANCLTRQDLTVSARVAIALICIVFLLPYPPYLWQAKTDISEPLFFSKHIYRHYLRPDENILIIPYSYNGDSMLWQAQAHMDFRMAGGWTGAMPAEFLRWPALQALTTGSLTPDYDDQFRAFLSHFDVESIVVCGSLNTPWTELVASLGVRPQAAGNVALYRVPEAILKAYRHANVVDFETRADAAWFVGLLTAANKYLSSGFELKKLSPARAAQLGLLPQDTAAKSLADVELDRRIAGPMLWLGPYRDNMVAIGLVGSSAAIQPLLGKYASDAAAVYFPYPDRLADFARSGDTREVLLMAFERQGLARAALKAVNQRGIESATATDSADHEGAR